MRALACRAVPVPSESTKRVIKTAARDAYGFRNSEKQNLGQHLRRFYERSRT